MLSRLPQGTVYFKVIILSLPLLGNYVIRVMVFFYVFRWWFINSFGIFHNVWIIKVSIPTKSVKMQPSTLHLKKVDRLL